MVMPIPILIIAVLAAVAIWDVQRRLRRRRETPRRLTSGLDILDARYASGEIGRDDYLKMKADISKSRSA
jgi:putative membrane protein